MWPTEEEMAAISRRAEEQFGIPNCPLGVDGTFVRLKDKPNQASLPDNLHPQRYWTRKFL